MAEETKDPWDAPQWQEVKKGESLWSIAQARYGNGNKWKQIAAANPKMDPNRVQAGQTITLP